MAYDLHSEVNDSLSYLVEDANSFFCEGKSKLKPTDSQKGASSVRVGTDCSGIGIPIIALENMGICFRHIFDCDHDKDVQLTIRANHSPEILYDDIHGRDVSEVPYTDLYVAGFPCQPFSTMGKQEGFEDTQGRGTIFFDILEYIRDKVPKVFILENVKGLVKINNGKDLKKMLKLLRQVKFQGKQAYVIKHRVMDTKEHGIPHSRPRWYCVAIRKDCKEADSFTFPGIIKCPVIEKLLDDDETSSEFRSTANTVTNTMKVNINTAKRRIKESGGNLDQPYVVDCDASKQKSHHMKNVSPCLTKSRSKGHWLIHKNRRTTIREMMRLQGIDPDKFKQVVPDNVMGQQLGNAMSVNVVERILANALKAAGLTHKSCLKSSEQQFPRWESGEGFNSIRPKASKSIFIPKAERVRMKKFKGREMRCISCQQVQQER